MTQCDCGAATESKWQGVHEAGCASVKMEKVKYWWSNDRQWFCLLANDGVNTATVSLTIEEAEDLMDEVMQTPAFLKLQEQAQQQALMLMENARAGRLERPRVDDLEEAIGHLGAALVQRSDSDDKIIMDHVQSAYDHIWNARKAEREMQWPVGWEDVSHLLCHCGKDHCNAAYHAGDHGMSAERYMEMYGCGSKEIYEASERVAAFINKRFAAVLTSPISSQRCQSDQT